MITTSAWLDVRPEMIPAILKDYPLWLVWKSEERTNPKTGEVYLTKVPYNVHTRRSTDATDKTSCVPFEQALNAYQQADGFFDGIGFPLFEDSPFVGIDDDGCVSKSGDITGEALLRVRMLDSYTEISPSGTGLRTFVIGRKPGSRCRKGGVEIYEKDRFLTVTGRHLTGTPENVEERQTELEAVYQLVFGPKEKKKPKAKKPIAPVSMDDEELLEKMFAAKNGDKAKSLWEGQINDYDSSSEADLALCNILSFWVQGNASEVDRLFRLSGLMRPKWDEKRGEQTYGARTVEEATARGTHYDPLYRSAGQPGGDGQIGTSPEPARADTDALTDLGNAERLVGRYGDVIRYSYQLGSWLIWNATRWLTDKDGKIMRYAKETVRDMLVQAALLPEAQGNKLYQHGRKSESESRLNAMISLARSEPGVPVTTGDLDAHAYLFNLENGTLNLRTGEIRPHGKENLITMLAPVAFDPAATCKQFMSFLNTVFAGNEDLISYMQRLLGYTLTGDTSEQVFPILHGVGANGKSTLLETVRRILGPDYAAHTPSDTLAPRRAGEVRSDLARLRSVRFVSAVETGEGRGIDENLIKQVTGGEPITARFLYQDLFEYVPSFKVFLATNHKPLIKGTDNGIWRRLHLIPFSVTIPKQKQDPHLQDKLYEERSGILNWMLEGCLEWQHTGLVPPSAVTDATATYRNDMDVIAAFLDEVCETGIEQMQVQASRLYGEYKAWCERSGERWENQRGFGLKMSERGFERERKRDGYWYLGIGISTKQAENAI